MNRSIKKIGQRYTNKYNSEYEIVQYNNINDVTVKFVEHNYFVKTTMYYCKRGKVHSPFDKKFCGIGYKGVDKNGKIPKSTNDDGSTRKEYDVWLSMLRRCYSGKYETWENCEVCERWQSFANFLEDLPLIENYSLYQGKERVDLDKDIKGNSKLYSLSTCKFVLGSTNARERMLRKDNPNPEKKVVGVNMETNLATLYHGVRVASRELGVHHKGISRCCNNKQKYAYGHYWYFKEDFDILFPNKEFSIHSSTKEEAWEKQNMNNFDV